MLEFCQDLIPNSVFAGIINKLLVKYSNLFPSGITGWISLVLSAVPKIVFTLDKSFSGTKTYTWVPTA